MAKSSRSRNSRAAKTTSGEPCVLCATDLSPASQQALALAAELAEAFDARLLVVHALEIWDRRYDFLVEDLQEKLTKQAHEKVQAELEHLGKTEEVPVEVQIRPGSTIEQVLDLLVKRQPKLLVIGCNSSPKAQEKHLGGMAEELLRLSPVPVLVARPGVPADLKRIVCALGGGPESQVALEWALEIATREKAESVTVINTFNVPIGYLEAGMTYELARTKMLAIHQADLEKLLEPYRKSPVAIHMHFEESPAAQGVLRVVEREKPDLLVVGSQQRSFLAALLVGSVAIRIVRSAELPVLVAKSEKGRQGLLEALEQL
jgi:nucleotide-binding universal stress UspA family protein